MLNGCNSSCISPPVQPSLLASPVLTSRALTSWVLTAPSQNNPTPTETSLHFHHSSVSSGETFFISLKLKMNKFTICFYYHIVVVVVVVLLLRATLFLKWRTTCLRPSGPEQLCAAFAAPCLTLFLPVSPLSFSLGPAPSFLPLPPCHARLHQLNQDIDLRCQSVFLMPAHSVCVRVCVCVG